MRGPSRLTLLLFAVAGIVLLPQVTLTAQRFRQVRVLPNVDYDGRFTFARLRYTNIGPSGWAFDYPQMERNFVSILRELSSLDAREDGSNVVTMDDPELFDHTVAYLSEPGYWLPNDDEAAGLRAWLQRGGFLIVDDFLLGQWNNFERAITKVLPMGRLQPLSIDHPIFDSFFRIESLAGLNHPGTPSAVAQYWGIFEGNDPTGRLMIIVNYNNDIGDYMEWSGDGWYPVNMSNDAYKLATNYVMYGLTR